MTHVLDFSMANRLPPVADDCPFPASTSTAASCLRASTANACCEVWWRPWVSAGGALSSLVVPFRRCCCPEAVAQQALPIAASNSSAPAPPLGTAAVKRLEENNTARK